MPETVSKPKSRDGAKPHDDEKSLEEKAPIVEVVAEDGDQVEPPPPEVVEPDPELSPEEAEQVRKEYLLTRFWISARGYWGTPGRPARLAIFDRAIAPDRRHRRLPVRHQRLESRDLRRHREARRGDRVSSDRDLLPAGDRQRRARRGAGVRAHEHPAPLAHLADDLGGLALARQWPLLPAQPGRRRPQESGIPHRRGFADRDRFAGRFHRRRDRRRSCRPRPSSSCSGPSAAR